MHKFFPITFGDLFAGGGGVTSGAICVPDIKVIWALNHSKPLLNAMRRTILRQSITRQISEHKT
jgi:site-specific DNA-cytosine methylase